MDEENAVQTETEEEEKVQVRGKKITSDDRTFAPMPPMSLHGRRQIFTDVDEITPANVVQVLNDALYIHAENREEEVYLEKYMRGVQPILARVKKYHDEINNKVCVNVANEIITFKKAEFAGEPIQYVSRGRGETVPEEIEKLNALMLSEGKQSCDMDLAEKMFTCGVGYRLVLRDKAEAVAKGETPDEAPFEIYTLDPENSFVIRRNDVTKRVVAGVNYVFRNSTAKSEVIYTVYTKNAMYRLLGSTTSAGKLESAELHNFGMVPMVEYPCNGVYMGAFEVVLPLLDAQNNVLSNRIDGVEQFIQAVMVFEGVDVDREKLLELRDLGALKIPPSMNGGAAGKVYYLNEQLDQSQTQTLVDDVYDKILQIVGLPSQSSGNTSDSSNNGSTILKNGWWNAEARSLETAGAWRKSETEFLKIILSICKESGVLKNLKISDIDIKFGSHSYEDKLVKTQSFTTLIGAGCSPAQAFTYSGLSRDPEAAALVYEEYQEQRAQEEPAVSPAPVITQEDEPE